MREIVSLLIGGCGNKIGTSFWQSIMREHGIDTNTGEKTIQQGEKKQPLIIQENLNVFLEEQEQNGRDPIYLPRCVMADSENGTINSIRNETRLIKSQNTICGNEKSNTFGKGLYSDGPLLINEIMDKVRKSVEACDSCEGIQHFHSTLGGAGSGLASLIISSVREEYPIKMIATASVLPSYGDDDLGTLSIYNSVLALNYLVENVEIVKCFDNQALGEKKLEDSSYGNMNQLISESLCGITSSFRFGGLLNSGYRKLATNLVPFPRIHFFTVSHLPFSNTDSLMREVFDPSNLLLSIDPNLGKYLTNSITFRGDVANISSVEECVSQFKMENKSKFKNWVPNNIHTSLCKVGGQGASNSSATMLSNTSSIHILFKDISERFTKSFRRNSFLSSYTKEGMDEMEFTEAESNLNDLICEYYDNWGAGYDEEEDNEMLY